MAVHTIPRETMPFRSILSTYPKAAIVRADPRNVYVFDRVADAFGHHSGRPIETGNLG